MVCSATHASHSLWQLRVPALFSPSSDRSSWPRVVGLFAHIHAGCAALIICLSSSILLQHDAFYRHYDALLVRLVRLVFRFAPPLIFVSVPSECYLIEFVMAVVVKYVWLRQFNHLNTPLVDCPCFPLYRKRATSTRGWPCSSAWRDGPRRASSCSSP